MVELDKGNQDEKEEGSKKRSRALADSAKSGRKKKTVFRKHSGAGKPVYGIRGRVRKPEDAERISEDFEEYSSTTRYLESSLGIKSYSELAPHLAKGVERVMAAILNSRPDALTITTEFICKLHRDAFGELFPEWTGSYRDRDVTVGKHTPPHYFEVPVLMRQYCDNLESRLSPIGQKPPVNNILFETLAFAEGCFLSIHPFYDFNGRVARMLLFALLYRFDLPPVQLVPDEKDEKGKKEYLEALASADAIDWHPLVELWKKRFGVKG
ncbi:MAG: Fic family protein [Planctomycetota bacterium]